MRVYAQRHTPTDQDIQNNVSKVAKPYTSKSMVCQYYNSGTCSQRSTHEAKGVTYRHVCFFFASQKIIKTSSMQRHIVITSKSKNPRKFGCWFIICLYIWSMTTCSKEDLRQEISAWKDTYLSWYRSFKGSDNRWDGQMYTQVLKASTHSQCHAYPSCTTKSTQFVATPQKNAHAKLVIPSKAGIKVLAAVPLASNIWFLSRQTFMRKTSSSCRFTLFA